MITNCVTESVGRKRKFWATRPCPQNTGDCSGENSKSYGLELVNGAGEPCSECDNTLTLECNTDQSQIPRSISTQDWVQGLAMNILMTDGTIPDSECGFAPGNRGGHWSDSYRKDGLTTGSNIRAVGSSTSIANQVKALKAQAELDMAKLIAYGVALSVEVSVIYIGCSTFSMNVKIVGQTGENLNVGVTGSRLQNSFVWQ